MILVEDALKLILKHSYTFPIQIVDLKEAIGKVLMEEVIADRDFPPYHRVTMDGIAIHYMAYQNGQRKFKIAGVGAAGSPQLTLLNQNECLEIMTGAVRPAGTDTIIRYEDLKIEEGVAEILIDTIREEQNVHFQGEDRKKGSIVIKKHKIISAAEIGVLATVGKSKVKVAQMPKAIIISTGDELVNVDEIPLSHQIRKSNVHRLEASLNSMGFQADRLHLEDDYKQIADKMKSILLEYPIIMLSGGVSKGKFDFIPKVMEDLGVEKLFHRIAQRPGKPFWFGKWQDKSLIFAFPGNPVSSFLNMQYYFMHWLKRSLQLEVPKYYAVLGAAIHFKPDLTYFAQVKLQWSPNGQIKALPTEGHGSGDLANLTDADAFIILPQGKDNFEKGEVYEILPFKSF